jgi:hypothetical protein
MAAVEAQHDRASLMAWHPVVDLNQPGPARHLTAVTQGLQALLVSGIQEARPPPTSVVAAILPVVDTRAVSEESRHLP